MKKFGIVIATVIVMALTGCGNKEKTTTADKVAVEVSTEATTEEVEVTTEVIIEETTEERTEKNEKSDKTTESVAQTTAVTPVQQTTSQQSSQATSTTKPASTQAQQTTEAPKPAQQTSTSKPTTTEAPAPVHQHTWATRTETVEVAWTETVEHPAVTHTERVPQCHYCGGYYADIYAHQDQYQETNVEHAIAGWSEATQIIVDQEAWTETINHPAVTKTVEYCTECGATK